MQKTEEGELSALGIVLQPEEVAFIKVNSSIELSPIFLLELRKEMAAGKKKKDLSAPNAKAMRASALERPRGVGGDARKSND